LEKQRLRRDGGSDEKLKRILLARASVSSAAAMRLPVAAKLVEQNRGRRTIVFHERVSIANQLLAVLNKRKHCATIYHSKIGPTLRRDNLRLYRRGVFDVLVTCRALDEGMNAPETTVAVIASSTSSARQRIQRLGRVLRPAPGKQCATIYTIYATEVEERRLLEEERGLDGVASVSWLTSKQKIYG
jgi:superfamily II DNA or RNA helicase